MSNNDIADITRWLQSLAGKASGVAEAGAVAGAAAARADGFRAQSVNNVVHVDFRGRRRMTSVVPAMQNGMLLQFNRDAR